MAYYLGFLKYSTKHIVVFKSLKKPKKNDLNYFVHVMGPYTTESQARKEIPLVKSLGFTENPIKNPLTKESIQEGVQLSKKVYDLYKSIRKSNPDSNYHINRFIQYMNQLEKYEVGSSKYNETMSKAYEHLRSLKDADKKG